jgi:nucleotide-binding universal stress UspA family protein
MYKRILVAVDGSNTSELALAEALKLAAEHRSDLLIVHVVDASMLFDGNVDFVDVVELENGLVESGRRILAKAGETAALAGIKADTKLLKTEHSTRRIADLIIEAADDWTAELVVVGTHGRRGISHLFLGSVAEGVVRISTLPVLLVRGR